MARIRTTRQARELRVIATGLVNDRRWVENSVRFAQEQVRERQMIRKWEKKERRAEARKKFRHRRPRAF